MHKLVSIFKADKWWNYKIGGALFSFLLLKSFYTTAIAFSVQDIVLIVVFFLLILLGFGINDFTDYKQDKLAGKSNLFNTVPLKLAPLYFVVLLVCSFGLCLYFLRTEIVVLLLVLVAINGAYSCKPFRFKEHKYWSVIATGFYERTLPYFIIIAHLLLSENVSGTLLFFVVTYLVWSFLWEIRSYMNGQMNDIGTDEKSGIKALISQYGETQILSFKKGVLYVEVLFLIMWLLLSVIINHNLWIMLVLAAFIPLFHLLMQGKSIDIFSSKEQVLDYTYNYAFLASILIYQMVFDDTWWLAAGIILLLLFSSKHLKNSVISLLDKCLTVILKIYYLLFFVASGAVNYSIYYFRKYILRWSEDRSRGIKKK